MDEHTPNDIYRELTAELYDTVSTGLDGDVDFYVEEAARCGSPALELGCGTGRILIPIAQSGIEIAGLDPAPSMLAVARRKIAALPQDCRDRIRLVEADMRCFDLGRRFNIILIPYRAFLHLRTIDDQKAALARIHSHLVDGGRLVFNVFDPRLEILAAHSGTFGSAIKKLMEFKHPENGNRMILWDSRQYDFERQVLVEDRILEEVDGAGRMIGRTYSTLTLRYNTRYEMQHLLNLCDFEVEALYGDFRRGPFRYGAEQVWVARRT